MDQPTRRQHAAVWAVQRPRLEGSSHWPDRLAHPWWGRSRRFRGSQPEAPYCLRNKDPSTLRKAQSELRVNDTTNVHRGNIESLTDMVDTQVARMEKLETSA